MNGYIPRKKCDQSDALHRANIGNGRLLISSFLGSDLGLLGAFVSYVIKSASVRFQIPVHPDRTDIT